MKKDNLRTGMIATLRNKEEYIVLCNTPQWYFREFPYNNCLVKKKRIISRTIPPDRFDEDMNYIFSSDDGLDIVKLESTDCFMGMAETHHIPPKEERIAVWVRK